MIESDSAMTMMRAVIFFFDIIALVFFIRRKRKYELIARPFFWLTASWLACLSLYFFSGIKYKYNLTLESFVFIIGFWVIFFLGGKVVSNLKSIIKKRASKKTNNDDCLRVEETRKADLFPFFVVSATALVFYVIHILSENTIQVGVTRNIETSGLDTFLLIFVNCSLVIWLYELAYAILNNRKLPWYSFVSAVIYNVPGVLISGRDALIIFIISTLIISIYCGKKYEHDKKKKNKTFKFMKRAIIVGVSIIFLYLILLSDNRYSEGASLVELFELRGSCTFPDYLVWIGESLGGVGKVIVNGVFYYSSQFSKFAVVFSEYTGPYLYGFTQLHYISRLLPEQLGLNYSSVQASVKSMMIQSGAGGLTTSWGTMLEYFIYDFTIPGSLVMSALIGSVCKLVSSFLRKSDGVFCVIGTTFLCVAAYMTVTFSPVFDYFFIFPVAWLVVIWFKEKIRNRKGSV